MKALRAEVMASKENFKDKLQKLEELEATATEAASIARSKQSLMEKRLKEIEEKEQTLHQFQVEIEREKNTFREEYNRLRQHLEIEIESERSGSFALSRIDTETGKE